LYLTIILPVRNEKEYISSTLESILTQTKLDNYEIIISDGCSTDGTIDIINNYILQNRNIHLIENPDKIVSTGFNRALSQAKGDVIIRIDGHCIISPNYIEKCLELIAFKKANIVGGVINTISSGLVGKAISSSQSSWFGVGGVKFRNIGIEKGDYVDSLAFGVHKRDIFTEIGGYDEEMITNQDDEFNCRAIQAGKKIWLEPSLQTKYISRSSYCKLFQQYFYYGFYKVRGVQKRRKVFALRHLVPSIYVIGLLITIFLGCLFSNPLILISIIFPYSIMNIFSSIYISSSLLSIPLIFFSYWILHVGYGFGFIWGLIRFVNKWKDTELKDYNFNREQFCMNKPNQDTIIENTLS